MRRRPSAGLVLSGLLAVGVEACAIVGTAPAGRHCPVELVPTSQIVHSLPLHTRIQLHFADEQMSYEALAVAQPEGLVILGLSPYGVRLFAVHQRGSEYSLEVASSELRHLGRWTLDLLHRVYWIQPPDDLDNGDAWPRGGEELREAAAVESGGRRVFSLVAGWAGDSASSSIVIDYPAAFERSASGPVAIRNPWCGYEAKVLELKGPAAVP